MNIFKRVSLAFKVASAFNQSIIGSPLTNALMRFITRGTPVWLSVDDLNKYIDDFYDKNADFAAVIDYLSEKCAMVEWDFFDNGELIDDEKHPVRVRWECPNPTEGGFEFRRRFFADWFLFGEALMNGVAPEGGENAGEWRELWVFPATIIEIISGGARRPIDSYVLGIDTQSKVPAEQMLHMRNYNPHVDGAGSQLRGQSKAKSLVQSVTGSSAAYGAIVTELQQQAPTGFLKLMPGGKDFTPEQIAQLQHNISKPSKGKPAFTNQNLEYVLMGGTLVKKDTFDSILSNLRTNCRRYSISSRLFNDPASSTFNNMISDERRAWEDALKPAIFQARDELNAWYTPAFGENITMKPNFSAILALQHDIKDQSFLTLRERYRLAGIQPADPNDPELDQRSVVINIAPEDDLSAIEKVLEMYNVN